MRSRPLRSFVVPVLAVLSVTSAIVTTSRACDAAEPLSTTAAKARKADDLFQRARMEMSGGALAAACRDFAESQHLDPAVGTLLNLATCEERSGKLAEAEADFRAARRDLGPMDPRATYTDQRVADLAARVPRVTLHMVGPHVEGVHVLGDDVELSPEQLGVALPLDPGPHTFVVRAPERGDSRVEINLGERERRSLDLGPGAWMPAAPGAPPPVVPVTAVVSPALAVPGEAPSSAGQAQRTLGLVGGGVGLAGVAAGVVLAFVAKSTYDSAVQDHCATVHACTPEGVSDVNSAHSQATGATVAIIAGGALAVTGAVLYLTAPREKGGGIHSALAVGMGRLSVQGEW